MMLTLIMILLLFGLMLVGDLFLYRLKKQRKVTLRREINRMDNLNGYEFEDYTIWLLKRNHFVNIIHTDQNNDFGLDVIAERNHVKYGFQCKHYKKRPVDRKTLRVTADGAHYYHVQRAVILTNQSFTRDAQNYQKFFRVQLWDRSVLIRLIKTALDKGLRRH